jgi:hypothetical protein
MTPLTPSTHHETALIAVGIGDTEGVPPASREVPVHATNQIATIKPSTPIALHLGEEDYSYVVE